MRMVETPQSSQIESAGHKGNILHVLFRSGALYAYYGVPRPLFNMSRTLSRGKIGPGPSFLAGVRPFSLYRLMPRRLRRVFPTLVFAV